MKRLIVMFVVGVLLLPAAAKAMPAHVKRGFKCIHRHEGAWNANTGNGYYGGLQMDEGFMRTYGAWLFRNVGTADRWSPDQQLRVAYRAHRGWKGFAGRGFTPWPNSARLCGLL